MSEMSTVLNYLLEVAQDEKTSNMAKLAALTVLNKLFDTDMNYDIQAHCLKENIISTLIMTIDVALGPNCHPSDFVYVSVAMETMWRLSRLPPHLIQGLFSDVVIRRLLMFLDLQSDFFVFPDKLTHVMKVKCENRQLIGKVKSVGMAAEPIEYIHRHSKGRLKSLYKLPCSMTVCSLFDTSQEEDVNLAKLMLEQNLVWKGTNVTESIEEWQDILVTKVIDGGLFWAQIGEQAIKDVCMIQQQLNGDLDLQKQHVTKSGEFVVVNAELQGTRSNLRAQVISTTGHGGRMIDVFLIDYGHILMVPNTDVYIMPGHLKNIPQKVSICSLDGIQATPKDKALTINAAAILANIVKQGFPHAGESLCKLDCLRLLEKLLRITDTSDLATPLFSVIANLGRGKKLIGEFMDSDIVPLLLEKLDADAKSEDGEQIHDNEYMENCVACLTKIMFRNKDLREKFYQSEGLDITLRFLTKRVKINSSLYISTLKLLKVFVGSAVIEKEVQKEGQKQKNSVSTASQRKERVQQQPKDPSTEGPQNIPPSKQLSPSGQTRNLKLHHEAMSGDESQPENDKFVPSIPRRKFDDSSQHYVLGSCVYISDDQKHELVPATSVKDITTSSIAKIICGMLNSGRSGTVYCGIDKDGIVFGLELSRDEKDRFRLGVDMMKLNPLILHSNFEFKALPVFDKKENDFVPDLYVIEIHAKAARSTTYTTQDDKCYYRYGSATNALGPQEIRQIVAVEEEECYRAEIERLLERRNSLLQK